MLSYISQATEAVSVAVAWSLVLPLTARTDLPGVAHHSVGPAGMACGRCCGLVAEPRSYCVDRYGPPELMRSLIQLSKRSNHLSRSHNRLL
jgi:hypothetical protein